MKISPNFFTDNQTFYKKRKRQKKTSKSPKNTKKMKIYGDVFVSCSCSIFRD